MQKPMRSRAFKKILQFTILLICMSALLLPDFEPAARAASKSDLDTLQENAGKLAAQKKSLKSKLSALSGNKSKALERKALLDKQISVLSDQVSNAEAQIADYDRLISQTQARLNETQEKERAQYQLFRTRVRAMEERGTVSYWAVLFHASSFTDLLSRVDFVNEIMDSDQSVINKLQKLQDQVSNRQKDLRHQKSESESAAADLAVRKSELNTQQKATVSLMKQIEGNEADYKSALSEIAKEEDAINDKIAQMAKELAKQSGSHATYGGYIWPETVSKTISSPFGPRVSPGGIGSTNHKGVDICGVGDTTQVLAAKAGTVIISQYSSSYGNYIVINHGGGNTTLYAHLSSREVGVGAAVSQGQVIGITGCTGHATGPHLHFGITENGEWVNPLKYLTDYIKAW